MDNNSSKENKEASTVKSPVTLNTPIISPPAVYNRRRTPLSGKICNSSSSNKNSSHLSNSAENNRKKCKPEEVEEEEDYESSNYEEERPTKAKSQTKQTTSRGFLIPKGPVMGATKETANEQSNQERDKAKAATIKIPKKVAASPKTKKDKR